MKKMIGSALVAFAMATASVPAAAQKLSPSVIMVVDMERIINESAAGKQASNELQTKVNALQTRGQALQTQLQTEAKAIQDGQQNKSLQGAALEQRVKKFQESQESARRELGQLEQQIQASRNYVMQQISDAATPIITEVMRQRGAAIVLDQNATIQHSGSVNVTNDIITRVNTTLPRVSTTPPAQPAQQQ